MTAFVVLIGIIFSCWTQVFADPDRCFLEKATGPCQASIPNYFYNTQTGQCEKFMYGGCGGNDNRFVSLDDCTQSCSCQVKPDAGPCKAIHERWYYNPTRWCCEKFLYGGCKGNGNNFESHAECNKVCAGSFTIDLKPRGLNWGSMKITSISGDRSMGGTFGKKFGGSRTVWLHKEGAPMLGKGVIEAMAKSRTMQIPGAKSSLQIVGREVTGPGLVKAEKTSQTWSSGPIQTGVRRSMQITPGGPVVSGGMTQISGQSGPMMSMGGGEFSMNSLSGKGLGGMSPGGLTVSSQGGIIPGGMRSSSSAMGGMGSGSFMGGVVPGSMKSSGGFMGGMNSAGGVMSGGMPGGLNSGFSTSMRGGSQNFPMGRIVS